MYLMHHGIKGQRWGIQNGPPYPLNSQGKADSKMTKKNLENARVANLNKWGTSPENNTLYVLGRSGSGKSTTANGLAKPGDSVIHLDGYTEAQNSGVTNKKFNSYLDRNLPKWRDISKPRYDQKDYWDLVDKFIECVDSYSRNEFRNGHKVIVEGVQLQDEWWTGGNKDWFKDRPTIIVDTNTVSSMIRGYSRDTGNLPIGLITQPTWVINYLQTASRSNKTLNEIADSIEAQRGKKFIEDLFT